MFPPGLLAPGGVGRVTVCGFTPGLEGCCGRTVVAGRPTDGGVVGFVDGTVVGFVEGLLTVPVVGFVEGLLTVPAVGLAEGLLTVPAVGFVDGPDVGRDTEVLGLCTVGRDDDVDVDVEIEFGLAGLEERVVVVFLDGVDVDLVVVDLEVVVDVDLDGVEPLFPLLVCAKASD